jgi:glutamate formiminotransferase/formiminotetrahydrofolate cyclodeaminase
MVAGLTIGKKKYAAVESEMAAVADSADALTRELSRLVERDAAAYALVSGAYKLPKGNEAADAARSEAITKALLGAAEVPLETARLCVSVAELAARVAEKGNTNAVTDAGVAALLAEAACKGAAWNVRVNVASLSDRSAGAQLEREAIDLVAAASHAAAEAAAIVEKSVAG